MKLFLRARSDRAFTMVEIALCLAIVGFALVAIIGALPRGMSVQEINRQETIINQDAAVWMDAIRNGAQGYDDLTNYLVSITNYWREYDFSNNVPASGPGIDWYTVKAAEGTSQSVNSGYAADDGFRIIGLLSTPRYVDLGGGLVRSNYTVAYVRSMSGAAADKTPQRNQDVLDSAFTYRMIVENTPLPTEVPGTNVIESRLWDLQRANSRDLRITFRWPVLPRSIGNGRQTYRQIVSGSLSVSNDFGQQLHFIKPSTFVQVP